MKFEHKDFIGPTFTITEEQATMLKKWIQDENKKHLDIINAQLDCLRMAAFKPEPQPTDDQ